MKVKISDYPSWIGPYQIAEKILFWKDKYEDDKVHEFGDWLAGKKKDSWLYKACNWWHKHLQNDGERRVYVRIDDHDVYSADTTLALIILPVLQKLREKKNGSPHIDNDDVPEHLCMSERELLVFNDAHWNEELGATDEEKEAANKKFHDRWDWILDEMIWAFTQHADSNWESQFHSGEHDIRWQKKDVDGNDLPDDAKEYHHSVMLTGPKDTHVYNKAGADEWRARMDNGRRLFAKYYVSLWW